MFSIKPLNASSGPSQKEIDDFVNAAGNGRDERVREFLNKYKYGNIIDSKDRNGFTALVDAARRGHQDTVELLLGMGAAIDEPGGSGWTPLMEAALCSQEHIVKLLLEKGASIEMPEENGVTALHIARAGESTPETIVLLEVAQKAYDLAEDIADFSPALKHDMPVTRPPKDLKSMKP